MSFRTPRPAWEGGGIVFVYYRLAASDLAAAMAAVRHAQQRLRAHHAGLHARLMRRPEPLPSGEWTLMETYDMPGGVGPALQAAIADELALALQPWLAAAARHVEIFEECPCAS